MTDEVVANYWRVSVFKNWLAAGGTKWVNTYEFVDNISATADSPQWDGLAEALVNFEKRMHVTQVWIDRVVISTWLPDATPYNPETFRVIPAGVYGTRSGLGGDRLDLNATLNVRRYSTNGRSGKLAYRGVATEEDATAGAGGFWQLDPNSPVGPAGVVWTEAYAEISPYVGGPGIDGLAMAMIGAYGDDPLPVARGVTLLSPYGMGFVRMNKRHFNRPNA